MKTNVSRALIILMLATPCAAQSLSAKWEELTAPDYQGDSSGATAARGDAATKAAAERIANAIRAIKADDASPRLQKEFFERSTQPVATKR
jgi:hypothetical protein